MKIKVAELLFCDNIYQVLIWFSKHYKMHLPSEENFYEISANSDIITIGVWLDSIGTIAVLKCTNNNFMANFFEKSLSLPIYASNAAEVVRLLERYNSEPPPRLTLWTTTEVIKNIELDFELARFLEERGFYRDFANNWDYF